ncbi:unnamed protein product [Durusdinium trenchii]|uniref:C3H1-type domain-containing protein n=1 Tax=Durusdinium trenchii TaxID=1381693 RepID=A0ABP0SIE8_9DINO
MGCRRSASARRSRSRSARRASPPRASPRRSARRSPPRRRSTSRRRSPPRRSPPRRSPPRRSPPRRSPPRRRSNSRRSPPRRSPPRRSPPRGNSRRRSPPRRSPVRRSPRRTPPRRSPLRRPSPRRSRSRDGREGRSPGRGDDGRGKLGETDASNDGKLGATQGDTKNEGSGILTADVLAEAAKRAALARANAIKTLHASRDRACVFFLQGHCKLYSKCTNFHPSDEAEKQRWLDDYFATKCMLAERCTTPACLYSHPGQVRGQPPPGGTIEDAEQQDAQFKAEKAARDKLKVAQETAMSKNQSGEQSSHLSEAASHAAMKLGLNRPPPPPPPELLAVSGQDLQTPGEAADDPMEAEIRRMMQQQQQEYQAKQIVQGSATMKAGSPMPPSPLAREWNDKSSQEEGGCPTTPGSNMSRTTPLSKAAKRTSAVNGKCRVAQMGVTLSVVGHRSETSINLGVLFLPSIFHSLSDSVCCNSCPPWS